jgi:hypothetical protein
MQELPSLAVEAGRHVDASHLRRRLRQVFSTRAARLGTLHELKKRPPVAILAEAIGYSPPPSNGTPSTPQLPTRATSVPSPTAMDHEQTEANSGRLGTYTSFSSPICSDRARRPCQHIVVT